ncbi:MAG: response regulator [Candidatus Omnitrophota bacterium]
MKRILIIDDEEDFARFIKKNLEETGEFKAEMLNDAKDVLKGAKLFMPDLILLDLVMPDIGGLEVCEILNNDKDTQEIPIIIVSALGGYTDIKRAYKLGVIGYLTKPFDFSHLLDEVRKALSRKEGK